MALLGGFSTFMSPPTLNVERKKADAMAQLASKIDLKKKSNSCTKLERVDQLLKVRRVRHRHRMQSA